MSPSRRRSGGCEWLVERADLLARVKVVAGGVDADCRLATVIDPLEAVCAEEEDFCKVAASQRSTTCVECSLLVM